MREPIPCPGLCSICAAPADKVCPNVAAKEAAHTPNDGLIVATGLSGTEWGVFRRSASGGLHRVKSPALPMVATREEAERNLAAYLVKKGARQ